MSQNNQLALHNVGVLYHPKLNETRVMAAEILEFIEIQGGSAWVSSSWKPEVIQENLKQSDLLITLGGDGSLLRAARMTAHQGIPILGIHLGHLGFLVEVQPAEWIERIAQTLFGDYWIEKRMMVQAQQYRQDTLIATYEALNEVVISRGRIARVVHFDTKIDGSYLTTYVADGLIIATSTGSTAYALAAGGPILPPELENILLIPIAPHLSLDRAMVLPQTITVQVKISTDHVAVLTVDGQQEVELQNGDELHISASPSKAQFVRLRERNYFYRTLMERMGRKS